MKDFIFFHNAKEDGPGRQWKRSELFKKRNELEENEYCWLAGRKLIIL
jgi:hypothetical protein